MQHLFCGAWDTWLTVLCSLKVRLDEHLDDGFGERRTGRDTPVR